MAWPTKKTTVKELTVKRTPKKASQVEEKSMIESETPMPVGPEAEVAKPSKSIPIFDHTADVGVEESKLRKSLLQGGHRFTFAEYNYNTKLFVPEPKFIPPGRVEGNELLDKVNAMLKRMGELETELLSVRTDILNNMDSIVGS